MKFWARHCEKKKKSTRSFLINKLGIKFLPGPKFYIANAVNICNATETHFNNLCEINLLI